MRAFSRRRRPSSRVLSVLIALIAAGPIEARQDGPPPIEAVRAALRASEFEEAARLAQAGLNEGMTPVDEALYLQALALYHHGEYERSVETARRVQREHEESIWLGKARFLEAQALVRQRLYEGAERIYEEEAFRLLSAERKSEIAQVLVDFAEDLSRPADPDDPGAKAPDHARAYTLLAQVLDMQIPRELRDEVLYELARSASAAGRPGEAIGHLHTYLHEFDPGWMGPVDSSERIRRLLRQNPPAPGRHIAKARFELARAQLETGQIPAARQNLRDLLATLDEADGTLRAAASWQMVRTYRMPDTPPAELELAVKAARDYLAVHRDHRHSVEAAWLIAQTWHRHGRLDDAIAAYQRFIDGDEYELPAGDDASGAGDPSPSRMQEQWRPLAFHTIGGIRFQQRQFEQAIKWWQRYTSEFPNGAQWSTAQHRIIDAEYMLAIGAVSEARDETVREDGAEASLRRFLERHPLDRRAAQILFILGQMHASEGDDLAERGARDEAHSEYGRAIEQWSKLVSKYPGTEESSLALYRTGTLSEEKLGRLDDAVDAYRRLTWGSWAQQARQRLAVMTQKHLSLRTERTFRTDETPSVRVDLRNVESLTIRQYFLDPEAYFRKTHGLVGVEDLDIALIEPDRTWEIEIDDYTRYRPVEQIVPIPFDDDRPGVCVVNIAEDDLEATTLVVRSDLDLVMRCSRREVLVYVQDMRRDAPADDVRVLVSDGTGVVLSDETGSDGVCRRRLAELTELDDVRVFATRDGHIASSRVGLEGLAFSTGLSRKGYVYTDRPAYQPGATVGVRGIIRDVTDGSYVAPAGGSYEVRVLDARGRLLWEEPVTLSSFGTFDASFDLSDGATVGTYTVTVSRAETTDVTYSGQFQVQQLQLQKMTLDLAFDRTVCFRGETVMATVTAEYLWGEPATDQAVRYTLPDGRNYVQRTDQQGTLQFQFDTSGVMPGRVLTFGASILGEDVATVATVIVPVFGFDLKVAPSQPLVLAGEPFDVDLTTISPDGEPIARDLTLRVLRREVVDPDPVLARVPWIAPPSQPAAELTVQEHEVATEAKSGHGVFRLTLVEGGEYILRVSGPDRFGQPVVAESRVVVSGDDDATKLRLFADADTLKVGQDVSVRLHSRVESGLVLLTWEGETIIKHRVIPVTAGDNPVAVAVGHEHFPNFALSATMMDGRQLRSATRRFTVQRQLEVAIAPERDTVEPGEEAEVELIVTDQNGAPVEAELSLALVDEALFAIYPDTTPDVLGFFQNEARRHVEFRVVATNGFSYQAQTCEVVKAVQDETLRLVEAQSEEQARVQVLEKLHRSTLGAGRDGDHGGGQIFSDPSDSAVRFAQGAELELRQGLNSPWPTGGEQALFSAMFRKQVSAPESARRDHQGDGWWLPRVRTDEDGRAVVRLPAPEGTSRWRLTARGVTAETLVGQATDEIVTRKELFVAMKMPHAALEGDAIAVLGRVHNASDYQGPVELTLTATADGRRLFERRRAVDLEAESGGEVLFDPFTVPAEPEIEFVLTMTAGERRDALARTLAVRPWGLPYAAQGGGVASTDASLQLQLPPGLAYQSRWLTISVGPSLEQVVLDLALGSGRSSPVHLRPDLSGRGGDFGSELLALVAGLGYARDVDAPDADRQRLEQRTRSVAGALVAAQHDDGGWAWSPGAGSDWALSSTAYWALQRAAGSGIAVDADVLRNAEQFLRNTFQALPAADRDAKAMILHALSAGGHADFKLANALYRERNALGPFALAYTTLTLANLDRRPAAVELLALLARKTRQTRPGERVLTSWIGQTRDAPWLDDEVSVTAVTLLAFLRVDPASPLVRSAVEFLLDRRGCHGYGQGQFLRGAVVAALAKYFAEARFAGDDFSMEVSVNGRPLRRIDRRGATTPIVIEVPADRIADGPNTISFELRGRGQYAYAATLRGFSPQITDPNSWRHPHVRWRRYYHAPLSYRGAPISAASTSAVRNVEVGQRVRVSVECTNSVYPGYLVVEEPLPAGMTLVPGSLRGHDGHFEQRDGKLVLYVPRGGYVRDFSYELVGYSMGRYRVLPTIIRDATDPSRFRLGEAVELAVLAPGERSDDPYEMNDAERYTLGKALFDDGLYGESLEQLRPLFDREKKYKERDVARMLLWIHTAPEHFDAPRVVEAFELLTVRHPELTIPFDRILEVGRAYREMDELERAWAVFRATIDSSFLVDSNVSALLQDEGQLLASIDYQESLWWQYPDTAEVESSFFALSQLLFEHAANAAELVAEQRRVRVPGQVRPSREGKPTRAGMLGETVRLLTDFRTLYPASPLGDDAAFSLSNALLELQDYDAVVGLGTRYARQFAESEFASSFQYMIALGHFWKRDYMPAVDAATVVADGDSQDRDYARYILGQIYHARDQPAESLPWYELVKDEYPDAREAIDYFTRQHIALDEVSIFRPEDPVELTLRYRNVAEAQLQVYKVDLMTLYLREKNLSNITGVNLAGIEPHLVTREHLGDGRDYVDKEQTMSLELEEDGAYLVICRGDDLFTSGLVLITPLEVEVQEDPASGRVRVNVVDALRQVRPSGVHVKAIGSRDTAFQSGETDLRGIVVADGLHGMVTVIARDDRARYAFHRGQTWLGPRDAGQGPVPSAETPADATGQYGDVDYGGNLRFQNQMLQNSFNQSWDQKRRSGGKGVQVDKAR